ncbi:hypothetical protein COD30_29545 [Escherichia coli]|nr:hypothetical protein COD30_29545 [Escherichia coli]
MTDLGGKTCIFSHPVYLFLREFGLQDSRGGSNLCTGSHTISDTTIRGITLHLYAGEHIDAGLYIFNRDFN